MPIQRLPPESEHDARKRLRSAPGRTGGRARNRGVGSLNRAQGDEDGREMSGPTERAPREERERRWVLRQLATGEITCEPLRGRIAGNLVRKAFIGTQFECYKRKREWGGTCQ